MNIGILGAGRIVRVVLPTIQQLDGMECTAIASRSAERADAYAKEYGIKKAYASYEELVEDPEVELIYIATPHSHHFEHMMLCLTQGKPVLCEKAFTVNAAQAEQIRAYAEEHRIYAAEALWTRYMPSRQLIRELAESGIVGKIHMLTANLSYKISDKERLIRPELAGGALLDVGIYGLNFALMSLDGEVEKVESSVQMTATGVDGQEAITLHFTDGKMAAIQAGMFARSDRQGIFYGEDGYIVVDNINNPRIVTAYDDSDRVLRRLEMPPQISGYEYEFLESRERIAKGEWESRSMPLTESVALMRLMDEIRRQWGLVYPMEAEE